MMDFEQNSNISGPSGADSSGKPPINYYNNPRQVRVKNKRGWGLFWGILFGLSVLVNAMLFLVIIGIVTVFAAGQSSSINERVIYYGPRTSKIAVINLYGIIDGETAQEAARQLSIAAKDKNVKAIILRVDSPGGTISGSDQIHNEILKARNDWDVPVVAFMRNIAASGGYYCSVACEKIIAEPTTITGSIGVIMGYLVMQELLEGKLGINPVIIKSGERKDWPSSFSKPTQEQIDYLQQKVIQPAFRRFVNIVADGRTMLTVFDVERLADGSIFAAEEALQENLIDGIGYFDDAVKQAQELAGIDKAQVVEYVKPFSFTSFWGASEKTVLSLDKKTLLELSTPEVMYLWSIH
ncbi:MAG: signal peptide peptidase SppA [Phycisphaerae bacterium]